MSPTNTNQRATTPQSASQVAAERATSPPNISQRTMSPTSNSPTTRTVSPTTAPSQTHPNHQRTMSPTSNTPNGEDTRRTAAGSPTGRPLVNGTSYSSMGASGAALAASTTQSSGALNSSTNGPANTLNPTQVNGAINGVSKPTKPSTPTPPPARPRRDDDASYGVPDRSDEDASVAGSSVEGNTTAPASVSSRERAVTPTGPEYHRAVSPNNGRDPIVAANPAVARLNGLSARSPSPNSSTPPPPDAFYYSGNGGGRSPVPGSNGFQTHSRAGSASNISADLLKAKEAELEGLKRRENWMRAALAQATKAGFVWTGGDIDDTQVGAWSDESLGSQSLESSDIGRTVASTLMKMKQEHARFQTLLSEQSRGASERLAEADRLRNSAVQEAAFYRAKLLSYESGAASDVNRIERERIAHLESQIQALTAEKVSQDRKVEDMSDTNAMQTLMREQAEERLAECTRRADAAEEAHKMVLRELSGLQEEHHGLEASLRDHMDRVVSLTSANRQLELENGGLISQVKELSASRDQHQRALDQVQTALLAAGARAEEVESQYARARETMAHLETAVADLRIELETRVQEAQTMRGRLADVENAWAKSREEADSYRALNTGGLGQLLDFHRELRADEDRAARGHAEKVQAMELEASSLRKMLREAGIRVDTAQSELVSQRGRMHNLESELMTLRSQLLGLRSQLTVTLADGNRLRKDLSVRDNEIREKSRLASEADIRLGMLRTYLAENGLAIDEDELASGQPSGGGRLRELESKLQQRSRQLEETELRLQSAVRQAQDAKSQIQVLTSELDRLRSVRSPSNEDSASRIAAAERKLAEAEASHKEKMQQMEADYQTAVHYVKGTEKMLRRMKDELTKQKSLNQTLQSELDSVRGVNGSEAGARTRNASGRNTPLAEEEGLRNQLSDSQRQVQRLNLDNQDLHQRLEMLHAEIEQLRNDLDASQQQCEASQHQAEDLQSKIQRLESSLQMSRRGQDDTEKLFQENKRLKDENAMLADKINLVLDLDRSGRDRPISNLSERRASHSSSENAMAFESFSNELDDWQRRLASSASSHQPMSDYDEPRRINSNR